MQSRRYPAAPIIAIILKVAAVALLVSLGGFAVYLLVKSVQSWAGGVPSMYGMSPAITNFGERLLTLVQPLIIFFLAVGFPALLWAIGDGLLALRDIERNTRTTEPAAVAAPPATSFEVKKTPPPAE